MTRLASSTRSTTRTLMSIDCDTCSAVTPLRPTRAATCTSCGAPSTGGGSGAKERGATAGGAQYPPRTVAVAQPGSTARAKILAHRPAR
jgi:hypothetical protein